MAMPAGRCPRGARCRPFGPLGLLAWVVCMGAVPTAGQMPQKQAAEGMAAPRTLPADGDAAPSTHLAAPSPPIPRFRTHNSVGLEWLSTSFADAHRTVAFELEIKEEHIEGTSTSWLQAYDGPNMRFTCENISAPSILVRVRARGSGDVISGFSDATRVSTLQVCPEKMEPPTAMMSANGTLSVSWTRPTGTRADDDMTYLLQRNDRQREEDNGFEGSFWVIYKGPELFFEAANLDPHQNYSFRVKAVNKEGSGQFSTHAYFKTKKGAPVRPEPPYVVARTNDSLTVRWNEPSNGGGHIHGYILAVQEDPKHQFFILCGKDIELACGKGSLCGEDRIRQWNMSLNHAATPGSDEPRLKLPKAFTIAGLEEHTPYAIRLQALNEFGGSEFSHSIIFSTGDAHTVRRQSTVGLDEELKLSTMVIDVDLTSIDAVDVQEPTPYNPVDSKNWRNSGGIRPGEKLDALGGTDPEGEGNWTHWNASTTSSLNAPGGEYFRKLRTTLLAKRDQLQKQIQQREEAGKVITGKKDSGKEVHMCERFEKNYNYYNPNATSPSFGKDGPDSPEAPEGEEEESGLQKATNKAYGTLKLRWTLPPSGPHKSKITRFIIQRDDHDHGKRWVQIINITIDNACVVDVREGDECSCDVADIHRGLQYRFRVLALNSRGASSFGPAFAAHLVGAPDAPFAPILGCRSASSVQIEWIAPHNNGAGIHRYEVRLMDNNSSLVVHSSGSRLQYTFQNLDSGATFRMQVRASNTKGWSPWSENATISTLLAPPQAPKIESFSTTTSGDDDSILIDISASLNSQSASHIFALSDQSRQPPKRYALVDCAETQNSTSKIQQWNCPAVLEDQVSYSLWCQAVNSAGTSPWSRSEGFILDAGNSPATTAGW